MTSVFYPTASPRSQIDYHVIQDAEPTTFSIICFSFTSSSMVHDLVVVCCVIAMLISSNYHSASIRLLAGFRFEYGMFLPFWRFVWSCYLGNVRLQSIQSLMKMSNVAVCGAQMPSRENAVLLAVADRRVQIEQTLSAVTA